MSTVGAAVVALGVMRFHSEAEHAFLDLTRGTNSHNMPQHHGTSLSQLQLNRFGCGFQGLGGLITYKPSIYTPLKSAFGEPM